MGKGLTEQQILKKLKIKDFGELTKDNLLTISSTLDKMEPEVAKKVLEQFPDFTNVSKEMLKDYQATLDKGLESNNTSIQAYYEVCNSIISSLQEMLKDENITFEEKKYIIEKMDEIAQKIGVKDSENKKFLAALCTIGASAFAVVFCVASSALGVKTKIGKNT